MIERENKLEEFNFTDDIIDQLKTVCHDCIGMFANLSEFCLFSFLLFMYWYLDEYTKKAFVPGNEFPNSTTLRYCPIGMLNKWNEVKIIILLII